MEWRDHILSTFSGQWSCFLLGGFVGQVYFSIHKQTTSIKTSQPYIHWLGSVTISKQLWLPSRADTTGHYSTWNRPCKSGLLSGGQLNVTSHCENKKRVAVTCFSLYQTVAAKRLVGHGVVSFFTSVMVWQSNIMKTDPLQITLAFIIGYLWATWHFHYLYVRVSNPFT